MEHSESIEKIASAMAKAQAEMTDAVKDSDNPFYKSKYADYTEVKKACFPALNKHEIAVVQGAKAVEQGSMDVTTMLVHSSGQFFKTTVRVKIGKNDAQGQGSAITYGRRYGLAAITGVGQEDDDGNAAVSQQQPARPPQRQQQYPQRQQRQQPINNGGGIE